MKEIYNFLSQLAVNNNREWFDENRDTYQKVRQQVLHITEILINEIRTFDSQITVVDPKKCVFRIFRDVRFSKDKRPYKTNFGAFIARDGRKGGNPGYYFHIEPGGSFIGGGVYMPEASKLKAIRSEIYSNPQDFLDILEDPAFKSNFTLYGGDKLKIAPKGFPKDFEHVDLLRYKSYAPTMAVEDEMLFSKDILEFILNKFKLLSPFNQLLNHAIDQV